jgi:multiple sugar transport system substrate-binding protein
MRRFLAACPPPRCSPGCGWGGADAATGPGGNGTIEYWLWDSAQQPGYQKCADAFAAQNPGLRVHISQYGLGRLLVKLTAGFIADTPRRLHRPPGQFAQFVDLKVLRPLDDSGRPADLRDGDYQPAWPSCGRARTASGTARPKDWDTIALFTTWACSSRQASTPPRLNDLTWNPADGGTFGKLVGVTLTGRRRRRTAATSPASTEPHQ